MAKKLPAPNSAPARKRTAPKKKANGEAEPEGPVTTAAPEPTAEEIRVRAYHRYLERGAGHGADFDDWLQAEKDLKRARS